jgi:hypothetical protein
MKFTNSPSLKEYKDGIPPKQRNRPVVKLIIHGMIYLLLAAMVALSLYNFSQSSSAQLLTGKGIVTGKVVDERGMPLDGEVFVVGLDREVEIGPDGTFELGGVPSGARSLVVAQHGAAQEYNVEVVAGATQYVGELEFVRVTPEPTN